MGDYRPDSHECSPSTRESSGAHIPPDLEMSSSARSPLPKRASSITCEPPFSPIYQKVRVAETPAEESVSLPSAPSAPDSCIPIGMEAIPSHGRASSVDLSAMTSPSYGRVVETSCGNFSAEKQLPGTKKIVNIGDEASGSSQAADRPPMAEYAVAAGGASSTEGDSLLSVPTTFPVARIPSSNMLEESLFPRDSRDGGMASNRPVEEGLSNPRGPSSSTVDLLSPLPASSSASGEVTEEGYRTTVVAGGSTVSEDSHEGPSGSRGKKTELVVDQHSRSRSISLDVGPAMPIAESEAAAKEGEFTAVMSPTQ